MIGMRVFRKTGLRIAVKIVIAFPNVAPAHFCKGFKEGQRHRKISHSKDRRCPVTRGTPAERRVELLVDSSEVDVFNPRTDKRDRSYSDCSSPPHAVVIPTVETEVFAILVVP